MRLITAVALVFIIISSAKLYASEAYRLKEGDVIQISVWGEENLNKEIRVLPDGSISFPLAGNLIVKKLTAPQVEKAIASKIKKYIPEPHVSVLINATEGNRVYILGKVNNPGAIVMTSPLTVSQALSLSGGLDKFAEEDQIQILRNVNGKKSQLKVKYTDIMKGKDVSSNHQLMAGDTILVP